MPKARVHVVFDLDKTLVHVKALQEEAFFAPIAEFVGMNTRDVRALEGAIWESGEIYSPMKLLERLGIGQVRRAKEIAGAFLQRIARGEASYPDVKPFFNLYLDDEVDVRFSIATYGDQDFQLAKVCGLGYPVKRFVNLVFTTTPCQKVEMLSDIKDAHIVVFVDDNCGEMKAVARRGLHVYRIQMLRSRECELSPDAHTRVSDLETLSAFIDGLGPGRLDPFRFLTK